MQSLASSNFPNLDKVIALFTYASALFSSKDITWSKNGRDFSKSPISKVTKPFPK